VNDETAGRLAAGRLYDSSYGTAILLSGIETLVFTGNALGTDYGYGAGVSGGTGDDVLIGLSGDDLFYGGKGDNIIDGGAGVDAAASSGRNIGVLPGVTAGCGTARAPWHPNCLPALSTTRTGCAGDVPERSLTEPSGGGCSLALG
jgi:Ca2+-binding RTX toxin-like protein